MNMVPCVIFEDEHLLAVNKPAGWNTHAPSPYAGEGIYEWLKHREPRWASLAIIHRLDKETSGVMVFGKTPLANRSLTGQFEARKVRKAYVLLTDRTVPGNEFTARSRLGRAGDKYVSQAGGEQAETRFVLRTPASAGATLNLVSAVPHTGRTHQIRAQAAEHGFPILGDTLYGGTASRRVFLHAAELVLSHPATQTILRLEAPVDFEADTRLSLRRGMIEAEATDAYRLIHGSADGWPGWYVEKLGDFLLSQADAVLTDRQRSELIRLARLLGIRGAYHKVLSRQVRAASKPDMSPQWVWGERAAGVFEIVENGLRYGLSFGEGYSCGLFLDQRDNRRRLLTGHVAADFPLPEARDQNASVLNVFAYTCGFSVCAAAAGAQVTSLDLSKKYLEWGRSNFSRNGLDPASADFIYGDAFDWMRRLSKKGRMFEVVVLDPPTFSKSNEYGVFRVEKDYRELLEITLGLLRPGGVLLACTNANSWPAEEFVATVERAVERARKKVLRRHYVPQPPDYPICAEEPAYLKTLWLRIV